MNRPAWGGRRLMLACRWRLLREPHGLEGLGFALERFQPSDLSLAHRHEGRSLGDRLDITSANADEPDRDNDLVIADRDEFLRLDLLALPHPLRPRQPLAHSVV